MTPLKLILATSVAGTLLLRLTQLWANHTLFIQFASIFFSQVALWAINAWIVYPKLLSPLRHLPSPKGGNFFLGHFFFTGFLGGSSSGPIRHWIDEVPNSGMFRYLDIFNAERIVLTSPKALAEVLTQRAYEFTKPTTFVKTLGRILGVGLFLAEGQEHKIQRKNLMPAFAFRHVKELYPDFWAKSGELVNCLAREFNSTLDLEAKAIDVNEWASRVTLDIIGIAGLGQDFHALADPQNELFQTYSKLFKPSKIAKVLQILSLIFPLWLLRSLPLERNNMIVNSANTIREACEALIQRAKVGLKDEKGEKNILSVALESGGFSDRELVDQSMTFLLAGHETTSSALAWAVCMLAKNPKIQARLRAEVRSALPNPRDQQRSVSSNAIDNLPYLSAVCNEVFRLYPPVAMSFRVPANDTTILGQMIPKDTAILIVPWAINISKELWGNDAQEFNPKRWLGPGRANTGGADSNYAFMTFLHGPRSCIGQSFAKGEFACLLAAWAWSFETRFADEGYEIVTSNGITARPKDLQVKLKVLEG